MNVSDEITPPWKPVPEMDNDVVYGGVMAEQARSPHHHGQGAAVVTADRFLHQPTAFADRLAHLFDACRKHRRITGWRYGVYGHPICADCKRPADECAILLAVEALEPTDV